ncbi:MAG TPA: hypothetical protein VFP84_25150 [Kofleriaceae bacterium]|nr:hypothetical protein [Kofleriaceae bacterium]
MSWHRNIAIVVGVLACAACGDRGAPPGPAAGSGSGAGAGSAAGSAAPPLTHVAQYTADPLAMDEPTIELPKQESFRLLDPGAKAGRAPLRYTLAAGSATFSTASQISTRRAVGGDFSPPAALGTIRDGFTVTINPGADAAPPRLALRALPGEATPKSDEADAHLATWRNLLQGRTLTVAVDDRGQLGAITFNDDPANARSARARDELVQRLLTTLVPLPAEPVAAGARWEVVTILRQGPVYAKQTATYALTARTAAAWKLHVKLQRVAEPQRLRDPALPAGATAELVGMFRVLEGDVELAPATPWIAAGTLRLESRLHIKLAPPGAPQPSEQIFEDTGTATFSRQP